MLTRPACRRSIHQGDAFHQAKAIFPVALDRLADGRGMIAPAARSNVKGCARQRTPEEQSEGYFIRACIS
jgi:hypothetical protein